MHCDVTDPVGDFGPCPSREGLWREVRGLRRDGGALETVLQSGDEQIHVLHGKELLTLGDPRDRGSRRVAW